MASSVNQHVSAEDKARWDASSNSTSGHANNASIHVPTPPKTGNYYFASDLTWKKVPTVTIN